MKSKKIISISIDIKLYNHINEKRGKVSLSKYCNDLLWNGDKK